MQIFVYVNSGGATRRVDISYRISIASRAACARSCFASFFEGARESDILRTGGVVIVEEPHLCQRHAIGHASPERTRKFRGSRSPKRPKTTCIVYVEHPALSRNSTHLKQRIYVIYPQLCPESRVLLVRARRRGS